MNYYFLRLLYLFIAAGAALLLTGGAGPETNSMTGSAAGGVKNGKSNGLVASVTSRATNSVAGGTTGSITSRPANSHVSDVTESITSKPTTSPVSRPTGTPVTLSPYADELAKTIKFDRRVLIMVKEETHERIQRLIGYDEAGYQIIAPGIAVIVPEDKSDSILAVLRHKLAPLKYSAFVVEMNAALKADKIGIIKGTDQYEILRIMHTDGDEYDISNQDVIDRLKEWEKIASFDITGAESDWVEIEFKTLPKDLKAFAEEVYDFSPDAVDEGPGTVEGLIKEIKKTKRLFLLWD